jgi:1,4-alpha-glucan branching enzyme
MIHKQVFSTKGVMEITFELPSGLWADRIYVVGDFNEWSKTAMPMRQERDGMWRATVQVPLGRQYEFRYLIDGNWHTDYHADGSRPNAYGSENSVLDATTAFEAEFEDDFHESSEFLESSEANRNIILFPSRRSPRPRRLLATAA